MHIWPLSFRDLGEGRLIVADDSGSFFLTQADFIERYAEGRLRESDHKFLTTNGIAFAEVGDLRHTAFLARWAKRQYVQEKSAYVILIPTLRCDLKCSYCQVSRAPQHASGFDWDQETLTNVISFIDSLDVERIQIEFQGGEPLLRLDLLKAVSNFVRKRFKFASFVVCSNLQSLSEEALEYFSADDVLVSTSLDGPSIIHTKNRTNDSSLTEAFHRNLKSIIERFGSEKVSALPTIDVSNPPRPIDLINEYVRYELHSIYLRPINYQGFARKIAQEALNTDSWFTYYKAFIAEIIRWNSAGGPIIEEFYLTHCLRRMLAAGWDGHTDLRNPNYPHHQNSVVDFDGKVYPSDEARMLARIRRIDLSIGDVASGIDTKKIDQIKSAHINNFDADCIHCPYQAFCGTDPIDDISRLGRLDVPRQDSWFCQRHLSMFDLAVELLYSDVKEIQFSICNWLGISTLSDKLRPMLS